MGNRGVMGCLKGIRHPHPSPLPRLNVGEGIRRKIAGVWHGPAAHLARMKIRGLFLSPLPDQGEGEGEGEGDASSDEPRIFMAERTEGEVCDAA